MSLRERLSKHGNIGCGILACLLVNIELAHSETRVLPEAVYYGKNDDHYLCLFVPETMNYVVAATEGWLDVIKPVTGEYIEKDNTIVSMSNQALYTRLQIIESEKMNASTQKESLTLDYENAIEKRDQYRKIKSSIARNQLKDASVSVEQVALSVERVNRDVERYLAEENETKREIASLSVVAPISGFIEQIYPTVGEYLEVGDRVAKISSENFIVRFAVPHTVDIRPGDSVLINELLPKGKVQYLKLIVRNKSRTPDMASMLIVETHATRRTTSHSSGNYCNLSIVN